MSATILHAWRDLAARPASASRLSLPRPPFPHTSCRVCVRAPGAACVAQAVVRHGAVAAHAARRALLVQHAGLRRAGGLVDLGPRRARICASGGGAPRTTLAPAPAPAPHQYNMVSSCFGFLRSGTLAPADRAVVGSHAPCVTPSTVYPCTRPSPPTAFDHSEQPRPRTTPPLVTKSWPGMRAELSSAMPSVVRETCAQDARRTPSTDGEWVEAERRSPSESSNAGAESHTVVRGAECGGASMARADAGWVAATLLAAAGVAVNVRSRRVDVHAVDGVAA